MKRYTIGVLIGNASSPYTKRLLWGLHNAAERLNVNIIFFLGLHMKNYYRACFGDDTGCQSDYQYNVLYDYANLANVDALIISYGSLGIFLEDANKERFLKRFKDIPFVLLEDIDENGKGTSIIADNYHGMFQIVEHLVKIHGYRRLTYLGGPDYNKDALERKNAFEDVLEKYGIPLREEMMEKGDYSECVEEQIERLFQNNPDMQAMVCANDVMAETAYKVCAKKGLLVGKDIAITGYDDSEMAETITPPLSTVQQNEFDIGFAAVKNAIDLCMGKEPVVLRAPAIVKMRASCGCKNSGNYDFPKMPHEDESLEQKEIYIEGVARKICNRVLSGSVIDEVREGVCTQLKEIIRTNLKPYLDGKTSRIDKKILMEQMNELAAGKYSAYISAVSVADGLTSYFRSVIRKEKDAEKVAVLSEMLARIQKYLQTSVIKANRDALDDFQQYSQLMPLISKEMINHIESEKDFYGAPMNILKATHTKNSALFILEKPICHKYGENWKCPNKLYLAAFQDGDKIVSYNPEDRPTMTKEVGLSGLMAERKRYEMFVATLFVGEMQYGILATEIEPSDMLLMHEASLQISIALNFRELYEQQRRNQEKLENLVKEVNEKNKILGFISEFDGLTGCLNRRGFMERAMKFIRENEGKEAVLVLSDLDHLKEINDCFGHAAGDFAICKAAQLLRETFGEDALIARIGGDEFTALCFCQNAQKADDYTASLKEKCELFNKDSDKPYYVEISAGCTKFICDSARDLNAIIADSDLMLYEAKHKRRKSVKRDDIDRL